MDSGLLQIGAGLALIGGLLASSKIFEKKTEGFMSLPNGGTSGFGFEQSQSTYPLFLNFYPQQLGTDFNLRSVIQKLKFTMQTPTITNGFQRGNFTNSGHGQSNMGGSAKPITGETTDLANKPTQHPDIDVLLEMLRLKKYKIFTKPYEVSS